VIANFEFGNWSAIVSRVSARRNPAAIVMFACLRAALEKFGV
jgi:hypothetical protein